MNANEPVLLECRDVGKSFRARRRTTSVLREINLSVAPADVVVIAGRSGAGKSTLMNLLAGLEPPSSGSIRFEGRIFEQLSGGELAAVRRRRIGIIFQSHNLLASWTALENVEAAMLHMGIPPDTRQERAEALLNELRLSARMDSLPSELSAGEQQRVAVARALVNGPALVLADEPTGDVDPATGREIMQLLLSAVERVNGTLMVFTHGECAFDVADRVLRLEDGTLKG